MYWKAVHIDFPEEGIVPIDSGYAVASVRTELLKVINPIYCKYESVVTNLVVVRYSGYELCKHALTHCNNLNIWCLDSEDCRLWPLLMINSEFLYDAV